jgi:hypothetical protein
MSVSLLAAVVSQSLRAWAEGAPPPGCVVRGIWSLEQRTEGFATSARRYLGGVIQSKGLMLFLKPHENAEEVLAVAKARIKPGSPLYRRRGSRLRFLGIKAHFLGGRVLRGAGQVAAYPVQFGSKPIEFLLKQGTRQVAKRLGGKDLIPTALVAIPLAGMIGATVYGDDGADLLREVEAYLAEKEAQAKYDRLIESDYRFNDVKERLQDKDISSAQAREEALQFELAYYDYFGFMAKAPPTLSRDDLEAQLLRTPLFSNLQGVIENGVHPAPGIRVSPENVGPISAEQRHRLFDIGSDLYAKYELIARMKPGSARIPSDGYDEAVRALARKINGDPHTQRLFELRAQGKLSDQRLVWYLMEDASRVATFDRWDAINAVRLKDDGTPEDREQQRAAIIRKIELGDR